jgi:ABC-type multidrug transport system ATPase subunit
MLFSQGYPEENIPSIAKQLFDCIELSQHATKLISSFSGGSKRKLSLVLALLGQPDLVVLDEPR